MYFDVILFLQKWGMYFMSGVSKAVSDDVFHKARNALKNMGNNGAVAVKLRAIIAAKEHGIMLTAKVFQVSRPSLLNWIKRFSNEQIQGLELKSGRGRKSKTDAKIRENIREMIVKNPNMTGKQVQHFLLKEHNVTLQKSAVNNLLSDLGFSYITPRPLAPLQKIFEEYSVLYPPIYFIFGG
jgi:transposase